MKIRSLSLLLLSPLLLSMFFLTACGTLEISVETQGRSHRADTPTATAPAAIQNEPLGPAPMTPTPTPWDYVLPTPEVASTPVPVDAYEAPAGLRIASVREGDVWLWTAEEREAIPLTKIGDAEGDLRISDDGQLVAFLRGWEELWMVSTDGTGERPLVNSGEFGQLGPDGAGAVLNRFEWVAGTHILAFNTRLPAAIGQTLNHDLHLLDADTLRLTTLLPSGEGGEFYYSPDGSQIALVTPNEISLIDADGENRRDRVLTYTPVATHSEYQYYARPVWAADGSALRVAIPPADPLTGSVQLMTIWHIPTDGSPAWLVRSVAAAPTLDPNVLSFSSDLGLVAYIQLRGPENALPEETEIWLELRRLGTEDVMASPDVGVLFGWAPASRHFAYLLGRQAPQLRIGQWSGKGFPGSVDAGTPVVEFDWLDAEHYLLTAGQRWSRETEGGSYDLILGDITGSSTILITSTDFPHYDFALVDQTTQE
jgi:hypothetical protein